MPTVYELWRRDRSKSKGHASWGSRHLDKTLRGVLSLYDRAPWRMHLVTSCCNFVHTDHGPVPQNFLWS